MKINFSIHGARWRVLIGLAVVGGVLAVAAWRMPWALVRVSGESMSPTFHDGDILIGDRSWSLRERPFRRGEVVVCRYRDEKIIKRIYALPGDEVMIFNLDGRHKVMVAPEEFIRYFQLVPAIETAMIRRFEVPPGHIFLLGDAPHLSLDSRDFDPLPMADVVARIPESRR